MIPVLDRLPDGFLSARPGELASLCEELTLIHLEGARRPALVVSLMLHGNEPAGLLAVQHLFGELGFDPAHLPRSLTLLVGNVRAAAAGVRHLDDQPDFNRIWELPTGRSQLALAELRHLEPSCILDVHNSSGKNPCFVGITRLDRKTLGLAHAFSTKVVHVTGPTGMLAQAGAAIAPAITLECGEPAHKEGYKQAARLIARLLVDDAPPVLPADMPVEVLENLATIRVRDLSALGGDLALPGDLEDLNFRDVEVGTAMALGADDARGLVAVNQDNEDVTHRYLRWVDGRFITTSPFVPVMLTTNTRVVKQDCLGYAMKRRRVELQD